MVECLLRQLSAELMHYLDPAESRLRSAALTSDHNRLRLDSVDFLLLKSRCNPPRSFCLRVEVAFVMLAFASF